MAPGLGQASRQVQALGTGSSQVVPTILMTTETAEAGEDVMVPQIVRWAPATISVIGCSKTDIPTRSYHIATQ